MMAYAWAPSAATPPLLYAQYTYVRELGVKWEDLRAPLEPWEIELLAKMVNVKAEADEKIGKVKQGLR